MPEKSKEKKTKPKLVRWESNRKPLA